MVIRCDGEWLERTEARPVVAIDSQLAAHFAAKPRQSVGVVLL